MATAVLTFKKRNREREKQRLKLPDLPHLIKMTYGKILLGLKAWAQRPGPWAELAIQVVITVNSLSLS